MVWRSIIVIISFLSKQLAACLLLLKVRSLWYPILISGSQPGRGYTLWSQGDLSQGTQTASSRQASCFCAGAPNCDRPRKTIQSKKGCRAQVGHPAAMEEVPGWGPPLLPPPDISDLSAPRCPHASRAPYTELSNVWEAADTAQKARIIFV